MRAAKGWFLFFVTCCVCCVAFPERAGERAGAAGATVPPGGRAAALRARSPGAPAAGVPAESGAAAGGPEERGEGEGEGGGPAAPPAELEAQPAEQPARDDPAGRIPGQSKQKAHVLVEPLGSPVVMMIRISFFGGGVFYETTYFLIISQKFEKKVVTGIVFFSCTTTKF